jgi:hypothetical protein
MRKLQSEKTDFGYTLVIVGVVVTIAIIFAFVLPNKKIPDGLPNDYYDIISTIEKSKANIYVYSDTIDFNEDYESINILSVEGLPDWRYGVKNFLVIDMEKYTSEDFATEEQIEDLYNVQCYYVLIVNNGSSNSTTLENFIDPDDSSSDLITYTYDQCHVNHYTGVALDDFPSHQMIMYAILDEIKRIVDES